MKHQEINKIDAIRELIVGTEMSAIQAQIEQLQSNINASSSNTQKKLAKEISNNMARIDGRIDELMQSISVLTKQLDQLSKTKVDKKGLASLFVDLSKKV